MPRHGISVVLFLLGLAAAADASHAANGERGGARRVKRTPAERGAPEGRPTRAPARAVEGRSLRPRRYTHRTIDRGRYLDVPLPEGANGDRYLLLVPRGRGHILIQRKLATSNLGLPAYSTLGLATRRYVRRMYCSGDCEPGEIDRSSYQRISLGDRGQDGYALLVPTEKHVGPVYIERVFGVGNFADVSPLDL